MNELWEILISSELAKETKGKRGPMLDQNKIRQFITWKGLTNFLELQEKDSQPILRLGIYSSKSSQSDRSARTQWKSSKKPPRLLRDASKKFRDDAEANF